MISFPDGFDFVLLFRNYIDFVVPFIIPALISALFVGLVAVIKQAKKV